MAPSAEIDPRVARTRRDVLAAAREVMLEEGWARVTLARVAERSGYARTTLYRHWPQRLDLLRDLIGEEVRLLHTTPAGDLREDLIAEMEAFQAALTTSGLGRMMIAIGQQARDDAELADLSSSVRADGSKVLRDIIAAGVERRLGEPLAVHALHRIAANVVEAADRDRVRSCHGAEAYQGRTPESTGSDTPASSGGGDAAPAWESRARSPTIRPSGVRTTNRTSRTPS